MEDSRRDVPRYIAYITFRWADLLVLIFRDYISTGTSLDIGLFEVAKGRVHL
jgi:hypothetical protein